jgi:hypothetical protein
MFSFGIEEGLEALLKPGYAMAPDVPGIAAEVAPFLGAEEAYERAMEQSEKW